MVPRFPLVDGLLHIASTPRARTVVTTAAVSFAVCHMVVLATVPVSTAVTDNLDAGLPCQLLYCAAVLCRFAVPLVVMIVGTAYPRSMATIRRRSADSENRR